MLPYSTRAFISLRCCQPGRILCRRHDLILRVCGLHSYQLSSGRLLSTTVTLSSESENRSFHRAGSPNPTWTWGQKVETTPEGREWMKGTESGWKTIDTSRDDPKKLYALLSSGIIPRPVAFVSSISEEGVYNIAPFSFFNQVSSYPPVIMISCMKGSILNPTKDTVRNIKTNKEITVNIISEPWVAQANACSVDAPPEISEWDLSGLTKEPSIHVKAPRVRESAFNMECELLQTVDILEPDSSEVATTLILGTIKYIHARNDCLNEKGLFDPEKLKPVARLGGITYTKVNDVFNISRSSWRKHGDEIQEYLMAPKEESTS